MPQLNIEVPDGLGRAVRRYGINVSAVCQSALEQEVRKRLPLLELTPRAREVLHAAAREAEDRGHGYIGTEHLLLGLLAERDGIAAQVLVGLGVTDAIRDRLRDIMESEGYSRGSNRVVDRNGNVIGYLVCDEGGNCGVVDEAGYPVHLPKGGEGGASG